MDDDPYIEMLVRRENMRRQRQRDLVLGIVVPAILCVVLIALVLSTLH